MDAVIARFIDTEIAAASVVAKDAVLSAQEKMFRILTGAGRNHERNTRLEMELVSVNNADNAYTLKNVIPADGLAYGALKRIRPLLGRGLGAGKNAETSDSVPEISTLALGVTGANEDREQKSKRSAGE